MMRKGFHIKSIVTGDATMPNTTIDAALVRTSRRKTVRSSDCSWRICAPSGQDDVLGVVNLGPCRD